jgi:hypothetical protein
MLDWLRRRQLPWAVGAAALAGALGWIAFETSPAGGSVVAALGALFAAAFYVAAWFGTAAQGDSDPWWLRLGRFLLLVLLSVLALLGAILGAAVLLGRALAGRITPIDVNWLNAGLLVSAAVLAALVAWWSSAFERIVLRRSPHWWPIPRAAS